MSGARRATGLALVASAAAMAVMAGLPAKPQSPVRPLPDLNGAFEFIADDLRHTGHPCFPAHLIAAHSWCDLVLPDPGHVFLVVTADCRGADGQSGGIRGQNGPIYVFEHRASGWTAVGGFCGEGVEIIRRGADLVAQEYWHVSAAGSAPTESLYCNGTFDTWDTTHM